MMRKTRLIILIALLFFIISNPAQVKNTYLFGQIDEESTIKLYMGENKIIPVSTPTRIVISNPNIIDVTNVTSSEITIVPKAAGKTKLVFWDNFGEQTYEVKVFTEDMKEIKRRVDNLLAKLGFQEVYTEAEDEENKVVLLGRVKTAQDKEKITTTLGGLTAKTIDLIQVLEDTSVIDIDVHVLELNQDATNTLGFTWPQSITITEGNSPGLAPAFTQWQHLFSVKDFNRNALSVTLDILAQEGKAKVLSRPRLACQSGKEAELLVGGEKPIFTTQVASAGGEGTSVEYKEYGIKLNIKPTVMPDKRIRLALKIEISEVGAAETIGAAADPTAKAYPLTKRNVSTELFLNEGQTLAIGGLIKQKEEEDLRKTPGLGDIPFIGMAFRKTTKRSGGGQGERGNSELFITLTPAVISYDKKQEPVVKEVKVEEIQELVSSNYIASNFNSTYDDPVANYTQIVQQRILNNLDYPKSAKEAGFSGTVKLKLHISYTGKLLETAIKESSGYSILDSNALTASKGISSYPPFPPAIQQEEIWIDIPITYKLD